MNSVYTTLHIFVAFEFYVILHSGPVLFLLPNRSRRSPKTQGRYNEVFAQARAIADMRQQPADCFADFQLIAFAYPGPFSFGARDCSQSWSIPASRLAPFQTRSNLGRLLGHFGSPILTRNLHAILSPKSEATPYLMASPNPIFFGAYGSFQAKIKYQSRLIIGGLIGYHDINPGTSRGGKRMGRPLPILATNSRPEAR